MIYYNISLLNPVSIHVTSLGTIARLLQTGRWQYGGGSGSGSGSGLNDSLIDTIVIRWGYINSAVQALPLPKY